MHRIDFRLLGPLDVRVDGEPVRLGGGRQRTVLTMLLIALNRVVSVDALIEAVWGEEPPATARNQIAICVTALRKTFRTSAGVDDLIVTSHPGYILDLGEHRIDIHEVETRVRKARELARAGDTVQACALFTEALSLWRGSALDGLRADPSTTRPPGSPSSGWSCARSRRDCNCSSASTVHSSPTWPRWSASTRCGNRPGPI